MIQRVSKMDNEEKINKEIDYFQRSIDLEIISFLELIDKMKTNLSCKDYTMMTINIADTIKQSMDSHHKISCLVAILNQMKSIKEKWCQKD